MLIACKDTVFRPAPIILRLLQEAVFGGRQEQSLAISALEQYYPQGMSLAQKGNNSIYAAIKKGLSAFFALQKNDLPLFNASRGETQSKLTDQDFSVLTEKVRGRIQNDILLPTLIITNAYGLLTDNPAKQYHSMDNALSEYMINNFSPEDINFARFALRYVNSLQGLLNGDLSAETWTQNIEPQLQKYAAVQDGRYYYAFLILNLIDAHTQNGAGLNNFAAQYYAQLFAQETSLGLGADLFSQNLPAGRIPRLRPDLSQAGAAADLQSVNVLNLARLLNALPGTSYNPIQTDQAVKLLNGLSELSRAPRLKGKDIILCLPDQKKDMHVIQLDMEVRLESLGLNPRLKALNTETQTFLGYKYYIDDEHNYVKILLLLRGHRP